MNRHPRQRDKAYLAALHELPCLRCGSQQCVEAAHIRLTNTEWDAIAGVRTGAGGAEKPSDCWCLPLCSSCHRTGADAEHVVGTIEFYRSWGVDPHAIAHDLYSAFHNASGSMAWVAMSVLYHGKHRIRP